MRKIFSSNLFYLILALIVAILLFLHAPTQPNPVERKTFFVPLRTYGLKAGLVALHLPKTITLTAEGRRSQLLKFKPKEAYAYIRFDKSVVGWQELKVHAGVPEPLKLIEVRPDRIKVKLEILMSKSIAVDVALIGLQEAIIRGMQLEFIIEPPKVFIEGAESSIERVSRALVFLELDKLTEIAPKIQTESQVHIIGEGDELVNGLTINPAYVKLSIKGWSKLVPVKFNFVGRLPQNLEIDEISLKPELVKIYSEAYASLIGINSVDIEPVDLSSLRAGGNEKIVKLKPPKNTKALKPDTLNITIKVSEISQQ